MTEPASAKELPAELIRACIGGSWRDPESSEDDLDPYRGTLVARAPVSTTRDCDDAIAAAHAARKTMAAMPALERAALLRRAADEVAAHAESIALAATRESGKAIRESRAEARRSADVLRMYAEEAVRIQGEHVPMEASANGAGKLGMMLRFPVGVVAGITPFNAPVSSAAHKLGPALAAGNCIILKPSPKAPLCMHRFVEAVLAAGVPTGAVGTLYGDAIGPQLVSDPRVDFVSFTGSIPVGRKIRSTAGMKRVALELGGVGTTFVHADADVEVAAATCARNAMLVAGQSCISVQNVYVHRSVLDEFVELACREVDTIRFGDPMDPATDVGTLIDEAAALRVEGLVARAVAGGARLQRGCQRAGALLDGSVLTDVTPEMEIVRDELFGPAMTIQAYEHIEPLLESVSASPYGLQAGIYTTSLPLALQAIRGLRTGGVIVNGSSRWRNDEMPYGGVKDSGMGREGRRASVLDMTEERFFVFN